MLPHSTASDRHTLVPPLGQLGAHSHPSWDARFEQLLRRMLDAPYSGNYCCAAEEEFHRAFVQAGRSLLSLLLRGCKIMLGTGAK